MNGIDYTEERKKFGRHVIKLRKKIQSAEYSNRSISQQELADRSENLNKKTIGQIERGETNPSFDTLVGLAKVLQVTLRELFNY